MKSGWYVYNPNQEQICFVRGFGSIGVILQRTNFSWTPKQLVHAPPCRLVIAAEKQAKRKVLKLRRYWTTSPRWHPGWGPNISNKSAFQSTLLNLDWHFINALSTLIKTCNKWIICNQTNINYLISNGLVAQQANHFMFFFVHQDLICVFQTLYFDYLQLRSNLGASFKDI